MTITKTIDINVEQARLFSLLTTPDLIMAYYPYEKVESDGKVGGKFVCYGRDEKGLFEDRGIIEVMDSPNEFRYRYWSTNHGSEDVKENYLALSYCLSSGSSGTHLTLTHENIRSMEYFAVMDSAWDYLLASLKSHAENRI